MLTVTRLVKIFPTTFGTQRFSTMFKRARHWSLSWATCNQSTPCHPNSLAWCSRNALHLYLGGAWFKARKTTNGYAMDGRDNGQRWKHSHACLHCKKNSVINWLHRAESHLPTCTHPFSLLPYYVNAAWKPACILNCLQPALSLHACLLLFIATC